jgi:hypothetical protein
MESLYNITYHYLLLVSYVNFVRKGDDNLSELKQVIKKEIVNSDIMDKLDKYDVELMSTNLSNRLEKLGYRK